MTFRDCIEAKKDGQELGAEDIRAFVHAVARGRIPDYQAAALLMAIQWRGMTPAEVTELTRAMIESGAVIQLEELGTPALDKHSTGGVGDKVTLIVAPLVAAAGVPIPMLSGRGLGHAGGTLDKMEAIPGFRTDLTTNEFRQILREVGLALMGQSREIAPADRKLYALRDVTATIESVPLIVSSILSKKFASGARSIVFDVKCGRGAFMKTRTEARALARALVRTVRQLEGRSVAVITGMDQPLGSAVGNALEVAEAIRALQGEVAPDLREVVLALGGEMLHLAGVVPTVDEGRTEIDRLWQVGEGLRKFRQLVVIQGGDARIVERPELLPRAPTELPVEASRKGWITEADALEIGRAARDLGAGRQKVGDEVDPAAGVVCLRRVGERVAKGETLAVVHATDSKLGQVARERVLAAYSLGSRQVKSPPVILGRVS